MTQGTISQEREVLVTLNVVGVNRTQQTIQGVLDTGYTGFLTLPAATIRLLNLHLVGTRPVILGDNSEVLLKEFFAIVVLNGRERGVLVLQSESIPLLGMRLLQGHRITLDVVPGGPVTIEPLS